MLQLERFAGGYPCQRKLPDGRVLDHVNTLNLLDGQPHGSRDYRILTYSHFHNGDCRSNAIWYPDAMLQRMTP